MRTRVVFDCMLYLQGAARPAGPAAACLRLAEAGYVELCWSDEIEAEIRDVLTRPKLQKKFPALTPETVRTFLERIDRFAVRASQVPAVLKLERDPKDEKYLNLALAAGAAVLVSRDNDLLELASASDPDANRLRDTHPSLRIVGPVEFLQSFARPGSESAAVPSNPAD